MQNIQASLECSPNLKKVLERKLKPSPRSSINKEFMGTNKSRLAIPFSKENFSPIRPQQTVQNPHMLSDKDHIKAATCLSSTDDPLWKHVCYDVIRMMGAASFLKIWNSTLGEVSSQDQSMEIHCPTEETAQFIQQYDFVILGSLQPYLPALKQLRAKIVSTL